MFSWIREGIDSNTSVKYSETSKFSREILPLTYFDKYPGEELVDSKSLENIYENHMREV